MTLRTLRHAAVSSRKRLAVRVHAKARTERLEWDGSTLNYGSASRPLMGTPTELWSAPWRGGRRRAVADGDRLWGGRTAQSGRGRARGRASSIGRL